MSKRKVYFATGEIIEATKGNKKRVIKSMQKFYGFHLPYNFTNGFSGEEINHFCKKHNLYL